MKRIVSLLAIALVVIACVAAPAAAARSVDSIPIGSVPPFAIASPSARDMTVVTSFTLPSSSVFDVRMSDSTCLATTSVDVVRTIGRAHPVFTAAVSTYGTADSSTVDAPLFAPLTLLPFLIGMTALTKERDTLTRAGNRRSYNIAATTKIFQGSIVMLDAGVAKPGATAVGKIALGRACQTYDNTAGAAGDIKVEVEVGEFLFGNSASGDLIAAADIGADCWIVDDQTVAKTNGSSSRSRAGKITGVDTRGVWVAIGIGF